MIQSWENLVTDGRTDSLTNRQTDKSDFIGRCPTNVEDPIKSYRLNSTTYESFTQKETCIELIQRVPLIPLVDHLRNHYNNWYFRPGSKTLEPNKPGA